MTEKSLKFETLDESEYIKLADLLYPSNILCCNHNNTA